MNKPKMGAEIKAARLARKLSREEFARLCDVDYATVANWELDRNAPKGPTLQRVRDVMEGRIGSTNLSAAEEALLERIMKEGGFKTRQDFFSSALLSLITKGSLLFAISLSSLHLLRSPSDWSVAALAVTAKAGLAMVAALF